MKSLLKFTFVSMGVAMVVILMVAVYGRPEKVTPTFTPVVEKMSPTPTPAKPLKFGVMADVHLNWEDWSKLLLTSKERGDEFVIIAGDMTSLGKRNELLAAKKVLDEAEVRYFVIPGNHDLWEAERLKRLLFNEIFGADYQSIKEGGYKFILVNNGSWKGLGAVQKEWLEEEVKECRSIHCVVVMHMPLNHNFSEHVMGEDSETVTAEAKELIELLVSNNVKEVLTGHLHYSGSYELEGIRTTVVGAVSRNRNTQTPRYTEFNLKNGELDGEVIIGE